MTSPGDPLAQTLSLAVQHQQAGRLGQAEAGYRQILAADPNHAAAVYGLGTLALQVDKFDVAVELIRRAIALKGEWSQACYHLGRALQAMEDFDQAITAHRRALALTPALFEAQYNLAVCLQLSGERDKSIAAYRLAIAQRPQDADALFNFSIALHGAGRIDESISALRQAIASAPDFSDAFSNLGVALWEKGLLDEAIDAFGRACELAPHNPCANVNLPAALWEAGRIEEAIAAQRRVVALRPDDAEAHRTLGVLLLLAGDYRDGLRHFEWRRRRTKTLPWPRRRFSQPMWDGADLSNRTLYLHAEQSIGDTIQFIRFMPMILRRGGKVIIECQPSLRRLFQQNWSDQKWFSPGDEMPAFDLYCPLLSLPFVLGIAPPDIPPNVPYLRADPADSQKWGNKLAPSARPANVDPLKIGLAWAGSPSEWQDRKRSLSLSQLSPLAEVAGVQYVSLQKGWAAAQAHDPNVSVNLADFTGELSDFADTAALIAELDLVISVDTAVAHLAGAMGKPVWTLLPFVPHWRWMLKSELTPWYPTMRLFRQSTRGDWGQVINRLAAKLSLLVSRGGSPGKILADQPGNP